MDIVLIYFCITIPICVYAVLTAEYEEDYILTDEDEV
jgi:hypothetical protein